MSKRQLSEAWVTKSQEILKLEDGWMDNNEGVGVSSKVSAITDEIVCLLPHSIPEPELYLDCAGSLNLTWPDVGVDVYIDTEEILLNKRLGHMTLLELDVLNEPEQVADIISQWWQDNAKIRRKRNSL